jgi:DNA modification methylase
MSFTLLPGDVREQLATLPENHFHTCVTSPPYWGLRDYGVDGQLGLEKSPGEFIANMVDVFALVRRTLREDGTLWLNIGDSYNAAGRDGHGTREGCKQGTNRASANKADMVRPSAANLKPKDLCMIPWRLALALQADGWWMRSVICWHKRSPMPESVTDRPTSSWEPIFLLAKSERYYYDAVAVAEPSASGSWEIDQAKRMAHVASTGGAIGGGTSNVSSTGTTRNLRNVWTLSSEPFREAHFAVFPSEIPHRAIAAGTSERGCCAECGAPWERVVTTASCGQQLGSAVGREGELRNDSAVRAGRVGSVTSTTTGWQPACHCNAAVVPCRVLEPFAGSGTTLLEAIRMGRDVTGIELNPDYCRMIERRIEREAGLFAMAGGAL